MRAEFNGFQRLFERYLHDSSAAEIKWEKIENLPKNAVIFFKLIFFVVSLPFKIKLI